MGNTLNEHGLQIGLAQIQQGIGNRTGEGSKDSFDIAPLLAACPGHQTCHQAVGALHQESQPAFGKISGIQENIIQGRAQTCGQPAKAGSQQQTGQGAHDIAQMESGRTADINRNLYTDVGTNHGQCGHQCGQHQLLCGQFFVHKEFLPESL